MPPKFYKKKTIGTVTEKPKPDNYPVNLSAKYLVIVESPSKCKKIENFLGEQYCCIASKGHIRTINGLKSIDTKSTFEPTFSIIEEKKEHVTYMHSIVSKFSKSNIILASDDDREGEAIAWHICQEFGLPVETTSRIIFHEITKNAIVDAVKNPTKINMNIVLAQHARQVLDMIVGYKISPLLWKYLYYNKTNSLSAGRCQTPALRLVYDNEKQKDAGIETKYKTTATFFAKNIKYDLNHEFENKDQVLIFLEKTKNFEHYLKIGSPKETKKAPPKPFNTSKLLQAASNTLHISPKETMSLCQQLYQNGYITYMRTESTKYAGTFLEDAKKYIINEYKTPDYLGNFDVLENKDKTNPHEAVRVTHLESSHFPSSENARLLSMYRLIWRNTVESCMSDARYNCVPTKITAPMEKHYEYTVEIPLFLGWKIVAETGKHDKIDTESQNSQGSLLLYLKSIESAAKPSEYSLIESTFVARNKHQHYTEASLISTLEELGIGRPSTFASIVDTIQERGYVKCIDINGEPVKCTEFKLRGNVLEIIEKDKVFGNEKNKLVLQSVGLVTVEFLIQHFESMFSYDYTKTMETKLDDISSGNENQWSAVCKQCYNEINGLSAPLAKLGKQVYKIDEDNDFIFEKFGPVVRRKMEDGTFEYKPVKKNLKIDLVKLKNGEYTLDDLYEIKNNCLGKYEEHDIFIKNGKFGPYVEWNERKESIKKIEKPLDKITLDDVVQFLESETKQIDKNILRVFTPELSIRKGKFGPYAFYKKVGATKPEFFNIKKFPEGFSACDANVFIDWIHKTYIKT